MLEFSLCKRFAHGRVTRIIGQIAIRQKANGGPVKHSFVAILALVCSLVSVAVAEPKVEEQVVGPAWEQGVVYTLSPRGMHVATAAMKGSRWVVTVDGVGRAEVRSDFQRRGRCRCAEIRHRRRS